MAGSASHREGPPDSMGDAAAAAAANKVVDKTFGLIGRRRQQRIDLLEALADLYGLIRVSGQAQLLDSIVRQQSIQPFLDQWSALSGRAVVKSAQDPDPDLRRL